MAHDQRRRTYWHPEKNEDGSDDYLCFSPFITCYFAFSLDHVASVDFLDDTEATIAAQSIKSGIYVGLAEQGIDLPIPQRPCHRLRIRLLSRGLPTARDLEKHCVQASMCLPVSPAVFHPTGRPPAITSKPFPWSDMYHHSPMYTTLRVPTCTQDYSAAVFSSEQDVSRLRTAWNEDETERKALLEAAQSHDVDDTYPYPLRGLNAYKYYKGVRTDDAPAPVALVQEQDEDDHESEVSEHVSVHTDAESEESTNSEVDAVNNVFLRAMFDGNNPEAQIIPITGKPEYDLSKIEAVTDPRYLFEEIAALTKIRLDSQARAEARFKELEQERLASLSQPSKPATSPEPKKPRGLWPLSLASRLICIGPRRRKTETSDGDKAHESGSKNHTSSLSQCAKGPFRFLSSLFAARWRARRSPS